VFSTDETFDIGLDATSAVTADYEAPFRYSGKIKKVEIHVEPLGLASGEQEAVQKMKMCVCPYAFFVLATGSWL
jgi:arylsulfatase